MLSVLLTVIINRDIKGKFNNVDILDIKSGHLRTIIIIDEHSQADERLWPGLSIVGHIRMSTPISEKCI